MVIQKIGSQKKNTVKWVGNLAMKKNGNSEPISVKYMSALKKYLVGGYGEARQPGGQELRGGR